MLPHGLPAFAMSRDGHYTHYYWRSHSATSPRHNTPVAISRRYRYITTAIGWLDYATEDASAAIVVNTVTHWRLPEMVARNGPVALRIAKGWRCDGERGASWLAHRPVLIISDTIVTPSPRRQGLICCGNIVIIMQHYMRDGRYDYGYGYNIRHAPVLFAEERVRLHAAEERRRDITVGYGECSHTTLRVMPPMVIR